LSPSHIVDIVQPCPLLDTPVAVRSMMLDYLNDHTAITYLSTCCSLHGGYHHYPLKQTMSESVFVEATGLAHYFEHTRRGRRAVLVCAMCQLFAAIVIVVPLIITYPSQKLIAPAVLTSTIALIWCAVERWLAHRRDCCTSGRLGKWRRRIMVPRVMRLRSSLQDIRLLPYLQHVTELTIAYDKQDRPFGKKRPLPPSLRTLRLLDSRDLKLTAETLPPRLTSLTVGAVQNAWRLCDVLPESLTSLRLTSSCDTGYGIGSRVDVLPCNLQRLDIYKWVLPLWLLTLPAALTELTIHHLHDFPLRNLPPQLQRLSFGGDFNQSLTGLLPSSLRVLLLTGRYDQPLTAALFASTPQLEELHLSDRSPARELTVSVLPRSLFVLRLGRHTSIDVAALPEALPRLRRVIVPGVWEAERIRRLARFGQSHGFIVVQDAA